MDQCRHLSPGFTYFFFQEFSKITPSWERTLTNIYVTASLLLLKSVSAQKKSLHLVSSLLGELLELEFQDIPV